MNSQTLTSARALKHKCSKHLSHARVCSCRTRNALGLITQSKFNRRDVVLRDLDARMIRLELKNGVSYIQRDVVWDNASRVTQLKYLLAPTTRTGITNPQVFGYDALDRLTTTRLGTATTPSQILAYDAIGNRTSATINGIISTYNTGTTSHRLNSTTGGSNPRAFTYDAMGNLTGDGKYTYTYWNNGRINTLTWVTGTAPNTTTNTATYNINALGQRVRKVTPSSVVGTRRFMYDEVGHLAGEYDSAGKLVQETIWLGDVPVATLRPKSGSVTTPIAIDTFYVHADHLGTPRVITRPTDNKVVWSWENTEAFGNNLPNENPSALGAFMYNLRMPGQYFDKETGTFYNYFRDYDPTLGRYVQSDPIGLAGGSSTFGYVEGSPLSKSDPFGLWSTNAHNLFIDQRFGYLPSELLDAIKRGSRTADISFYQGGCSSHMHAMTSDCIPPEKLKERMCQFLKNNMGSFKYLSSFNNSESKAAAYFLLGMAMHPIMDSTSPAHSAGQYWRSTGHAVAHGYAFKHGGVDWSPISVESERDTKPYLAETLRRMSNAMNGHYLNCDCN